MSLACERAIWHCTEDAVLSHLAPFYPSLSQFVPFCPIAIHLTHAIGKKRTSSRPRQKKNRTSTIWLSRSSPVSWSGAPTTAQMLLLVNRRLQIFRLALREGPAHSTRDSTARVGRQADFECLTSQPPYALPYAGEDAFVQSHVLFRGPPGPAQSHRLVVLKSLTAPTSCGGRRVSSPANSAHRRSCMSKRCASPRGSGSGNHPLPPPGGRGGSRYE